MPKVFSTAVSMLEYLQMCRMLFAFGKSFETSRLVDDFLLMASDQNEDHERNQGVKGKFLHKDGWGVASLHGDRWEVHKSIKPCYKDSDLRLVRGLKARAIMLHARHASSGSLALENTHPFQTEVGATDYIFCHNGNIEKGDWGKFKLSFKPKGTGDTERFFSHILSGELSEKGIKKSLSVFKKYAALNFILAKKDQVFAATWFKSPHPRYCQMKLFRSPGVTIISSEILPSFGEAADWEKLPNKVTIEESF